MPHRNCTLTSNSGIAGGVTGGGLPRAAIWRGDKIRGDNDKIGGDHKGIRHLMTFGGSKLQSALGANNLCYIAALKAPPPEFPNFFNNSMGLYHTSYWQRCRNIQIGSP